MFLRAIIAQKEISAYYIIVILVYEVVCLCCIPSKQCFEEMKFFKEVQFSLQSIHFNQNVVIYQLVVAFELVKCSFFQTVLKESCFFSGQHI